MESEKWAEHSSFCGHGRVPIALTMQYRLLEKQLQSSGLLRADGHLMNDEDLRFLSPLPGPHRPRRRDRFGSRQVFETLITGRQSAAKNT